ncbi:uncharacterized protein LOC133904426 isoform X2 [Phragmites australis]|uniref:uncharacterized protein LOC133904426 isoform X2 n=1 Tax=Phragmites australis TaxID=29695 RepID=UPI002D7875A6|nr:uncharacterized protein LOC133904426 isoform X2 [Phragmites australis]
MEAQKLRFVRCPRCLQLLVEYPSIPVYKCGGCSTVLRAKNRAAPAAQAVSESEEHDNSPGSLKGSPQESKLFCLGEQKIVSSVDQPHEASADGTISSSNTNSCESAIQERAIPVAEIVTLAKHQNEEKCSLIDGNIENHGEKHDKDTGANSSSNLIEKVENLDTSKDANGGKVDNFGTSEMSTLYEKTEVVQREERLHTFEENSGLSDTLRQQMGSRRFMLGGKMNDASRSDPHGRLIEELEMSFSEAEEPMDQYTAVADRVHGNEHDKNPQTLGTGSSHPCEEIISSFDHGNLKSGQSFHQENRQIDNGNEGKEEYHFEDEGTAKCIHGNEHIVVANKDTKDNFFENENGEESMDAENAHPCERSISSFNDGNMKFKQSLQQDDLTADGTQEKEEGCIEDDNMTNYAHGNENLVSVDEDNAGRVCGSEDLTVDGTGENEESHMEDENMANCIHWNEHVAVADEDISERVHRNEHGKDQQSMETENANLCEGVISSFNAGAGHIKSEQSFQQNELIADGTKEKEEGDMEDDNTTNCVQEDSAAVASFSSLSNKRTQCKLPSSNKNKEQMPYRYRATQLHQGLSLDSGDFKSIQNFESQMDGTSSSLSSGSSSQGDLMHRTSNKFNNIVRHDRLKKMDELRDQLSRLSSQKGLEKRYQKRGLEYQQQSNSYDVEQHFQSVDADSIPNSCALESYYGHGSSPRYQPPNPFSPTHTYTHCHFGHAQTCIPNNYNTWEFNSYYQSSYAESTILDHGSAKSTYKEQKRVVRKHILRPLSGACPFTICNSCFNLVQMPSDIYISKAKIGKVQCAQCSKVLVLSFPALYQADAKISKDMAQQSNNPDYSIVAKNEDIASHSAEHLTGYPVSINEEHGASFTRSFSTQAGSSLVASGNKVSDSALHRLMGYDSASQLLRHSRVFDDGYESFESMVPVSSRVSRRKNM